jgi:putative peptidoglycan lipid II flippase
VKFKPQTAIRGVFSVGLINLAARLLAYGKHFVITGYIGLSAELDAFYIATTILSLAIFSFGDIFDSLGIPRLVETLQSEGEEQFRRLAGSIFAFAMLLAVFLCAILVVIAPWTPWIAPGFTAEKKAFVLRNLFFLAPMAILFLPYHALGSFLRARRRFQAFYVGECLVAFVALLVVFAWNDRPFIIPISLSLAYVVAFLYMLAAGRHEIRLNLRLREEKMRKIIRMLVQLIPLYAGSYMFVLVDRIFASYLPTGAVSALSYGVIIVLIPTSTLMIENVFITPLAESAERGEMMRQILNGILIISVPLAFFTTLYSEAIIRAAFERGVFTSGSTKMTAEALAYFAIAIPALFIGPVCTRLFQILEKIGKVTTVTFATVLLNALLNYFFMRLGMGIKGLALASSISWYGSALGYILFLRKLGIHAVRKGSLQVLAIAAGVSAAALGATFIVPIDAQTISGLVARGLIFLGAVSLLYFLVPNEDIRYWRETVAREIRPRKNVSESL